MCAPPFVGEDCSIKDCVDNCNYNGWCSLEFPVGRCVCNPGYYGDTCDRLLCLNNCSYPNGVCNPDSGACSCRWTYSPYDNMQEYYKWDGKKSDYPSLRDSSKIYFINIRFKLPRSLTFSLFVHSFVCSFVPLFHLGEDCSYLMPYSAAPRIFGVGLEIVALIWMSVCLVLYIN